jgi:hypothetical protein
MSPEWVMLTSWFANFTFVKLYQTDITSLSDLKASREKIKSLFGVALILMLPSIFCLAYLLFLTKYMFVIFVLFVLASVISLLRQSRMKKRILLRTALYSSTIMVALDLLTKPFMEFFFSSIIFYTIFFAICLIVSNEKPFEMSRREGEKTAIKTDKFDNFEKYF